MYKTKLQEVCHQRRWGLPRYSAMKDGPDHSPSFKASVFVNGLYFHSSVSCNSSKEAQNDAAKIAFLHFTSPPPPPSSPMTSAHLTEGSRNNETSQGLDSPSEASAVKNDSLISSSEPNAKGEDVKETNQGSDIQSIALGVKGVHKKQLIFLLSEMHLKYKSHLQNYARWKKCDLPMYSNIREGPSHAPCFKATVTVDGQTFESPDFFKTLKDAEHAAAKVALMSLSTDDFQENDSGFYKNILKELAQRGGFSMPVYRIIKSGAPHMPTYFSYVEIEGEKFYGKAGKSKKEAEMKAAKAAYTVLMECALERSAEVTSPCLVADGTPNSTPGSDKVAAVDLQQNLEQNGQFLSSGAITNVDHSAEIQGAMLVTDGVQKLNFGKHKSASDKVGSEASMPAPAILVSNEVIRDQDSSSCSGSVPASTPAGPCSSIRKRSSISARLISDSKVRNATRPRSYLLCNRVRVYQGYPDIAFPEGITVMPISENEWVAVRLEFPNEQGY